MVVAKADSMEKLLVVSDGYNSHSLLPRSFVYVFMTAQAKDGGTVEVFNP